MTYPKPYDDARFPERLVVIESPYAGDVATNLRYLRDCIADCLKRGEYPYASHGLFPQFMPDDDQDVRRLCMEAGFAWARSAATCTAVYGDLGTSAGMKEGILRAQEDGRVVEYRSLPQWSQIGGRPMRWERHGHGMRLVVGKAS